MGGRSPPLVPALVLRHQTTAARSWAEPSSCSATAPALGGCPRPSSAPPSGSSMRPGARQLRRQARRGPSGAGPRGRRRRIFGESGPTAVLAGAGLAAVLSIRITRATPPFTNLDKSFVLALLVRLATADGDERAGAVGRVVDLSA